MLVEHGRKDILSRSLMDRVTASERRGGEGEGEGEGDGDGEGEGERHFPGSLISVISLKYKGSQRNNAVAKSPALLCRVLAGPGRV